MVDEKMAEKILEVASENAVEIQALLEQILFLVPDKSKGKAERLMNRLEKRMLFWDYLCDCHGAFAGYEKDPKRDIILDYDEYVTAVTVALMLHS